MNAGAGGEPDLQWLRQTFGNYVRFNEPMSRHTSFRAGGPAEAFVFCRNLPMMADLLKWATEKGTPCRIIGSGTNLLVNDEGIPGITAVLDGPLRDIRIEEEKGDTVIVRVMAGARMSSLCRFAIKNRLEGMTFALGIPGTAGGGIIMNAGTAYGAVSDVLESVTFLRPGGRIEQVARDHLNFSYRSFIWKGHDGVNGEPPVILAGRFRLKKSDSSPDALKMEARRIIKARHAKQPIGFPSAGCFFKNPPGKSAGWLIDQAGLKGVRIGGAEVSECHANFIINREKAASADILALAGLVKETVFKKFGVCLEPEVRIIG
jgi:UDP-N-acetylmuramate dehydrogenase